MTDAQKLEALVRRANWEVLGNPSEIDFREESNQRLTTWNGYDLNPGCGVIINHCSWTWQQIIFNHDFARALFGGDEIWYHGAPKPMVGPFIEDRVRGWQYHLQQAVISDSPIDYMYEAVFGNE